MHRHAAVKVNMCLTALEQPYAAPAFQSLPSSAAKNRDQCQLVLSADHADLQHTVLGIGVGRKTEAAPFKGMNVG